MRRSFLSQLRIVIFPLCLLQPLSPRPPIVCRKGMPRKQPRHIITTATGSTDSKIDLPHPLCTVPQPLKTLKVKNLGRAN